MENRKSASYAARAKVVAFNAVRWARKMIGDSVAILAGRSLM